MEKIAIIVDSSSGVKNGEFKDVFVLPLAIIETSKEKTMTYADGVDITNKELCDKIKSGANISTSQASVGQILEAMEKIEQNYDRIYAMPIPGTLSGSINAWNLAAKEFKKLFIIPQYMVSILTRWTVEDFVKMRDQGKLNDKSVKAYMERIETKRAAAVLVPDIKQLVKGGRISNFKSFLIEKLNLKLVICLDKKGLNLFGKSSKIDGCFDVMDKYFKKELGLKDNKYYHATILCCENPDTGFEIDKIVEQAKKHWPEIKFQISELPAVIVAHTGVNYVAVGIDAK